MILIVGFFLPIITHPQSGLCVDYANKPGKCYPHSYTSAYAYFVEQGKDNLDRHIVRYLRWTEIRYYYFFILLGGYIVSCFIFYKKSKIELAKPKT